MLFEILTAKGDLFSCVISDIKIINEAQLAGKKYTELSIHRGDSGNKQDSIFTREAYKSVTARYTDVMRYKDSPVALDRDHAEKCSFAAIPDLAVVQNTNADNET